MCIETSLSAVLPISCGGRWRRDTLVNLESDFARLIITCRSRGLVRIIAFHQYDLGQVSQFPAHFGWHNLLSSKRRRLEARNFTVILFFYFVYNTSKDQVYSISGPEFYEWLFETFEKRGPWFDSGLVKSLPHVCAYFRIGKFIFVDSKISLWKKQSGQRPFKLFMAYS